MVLPSLFIAPTQDMGLGVFTREDIDAGTLVEVAPVIVMTAAERKLLDQTLLHDYIFEWGEQSDQCCMALGYVPVYNHSYESNCEYEMDFDSRQILVRLVRPVKAGEELFINYNGEWNDSTPLWFEAK
ncbi:MAG: SET domain-containing protein-lysine N-methyltransferase [Chitinophagales bacterium]|nr:SET domain-containing protein-lysine N-methyltransferase [Chitinophagales bacterium]